MGGGYREACDFITHGDYLRTLRSAGVEPTYGELETGKQLRALLDTELPPPPMSAWPGRAKWDQPEYRFGWWLSR